MNKQIKSIILIILFDILLMSCVFVTLVLPHGLVFLLSFIFQMGGILLLLRALGEQNEDNKTDNFFSSYDARDYKYKPDARDYKYKPTCFSRFERYVPPVKNQGKTGACAACGAAEALEFHEYLRTGQHTEMSVGYIYGNRAYDKSESKRGMSLRSALKTLVHNGDVPVKLFPQCSDMPQAVKDYVARDKSIDKEAKKHTIDKFYRIKNTKGVMQSLVAHGVVLAAIRWANVKYDIHDGNAYVSFPDGKKTKGGHCILIYGWTKDGWLVSNSWGEEWGFNGRCIVPFDAPFVEYWGVFCKDTSRGHLSISERNILLKKLYKIINAVANFFLRM